MQIPITCEQVRISAMAVRDGEVPPLHTDIVERHVHVCNSCREDIERMDGATLLSASVKRMLVKEDIWPDLRSRIRKREMHALKLQASHGGPSPDVGSQGAQRPNGLRRSASFIAAVSILLVVCSIVFFGPSGRSSADLLVVRISDTMGGDSVAEERAVRQSPFDAEVKADDLALAEVGNSFDRNGTPFVKIKLISVYKGRLPSGRFDVDQASALELACPLSRDTAPFLTPGSRIGIYLAQDVEGWTVTGIRDLRQNEDSWRTSVTRFCDVLLACESEDSAQRYRDLLPVSVPATLDVPAYYAILAKPCPHAQDAIRPLWELATAMNHTGTEGDPAAGQQNAKADTSQSEAADSDRTGQKVADAFQLNLESEPHLKISLPLALATLLSRTNDSASVESVLHYGLHQPAGMRAEYLELLPGLSQTADAPTIRATCETLTEFLNNEPASAELPASLNRDHGESDDDPLSGAGRVARETSRAAAVVRELQQLLSRKRDPLN